MLDFTLLANQCAPDVAPQILERLIKVESSFQPYAIGVVGGRLARQPAHKQEAMATAAYLEQAGWNFSMGLGQVNRYNLTKYGLDYDSVFEPCQNIRAAAGIFNTCLQRAATKFPPEQALLAAFSCYYSGNFKRGFLPEGRAQTSYVERIMAVKPQLTSSDVAPIRVIPDSNARAPKTSTVGRENTPASSGAKISRTKAPSPAREVKALRGN